MLAVFQCVDLTAVICSRFLTKSMSLAMFSQFRTWAEYISSDSNTVTSDTVRCLAGNESIVLKFFFFNLNHCSQCMKEALEMTNSRAAAAAQGTSSSHTSTALYFNCSSPVRIESLPTEISINPVSQSGWPNLSIRLKQMYIYHLSLVAERDIWIVAMWIVFFHLGDLTGGVFAHMSSPAFNGYKDLIKTFPLLGTSSLQKVCHIMSSA